MTQEKTKTGRTTRRVYIPLLDKSNLLVTYKDVEFDWHMGMSAAVRKRSIHSLHENIIKTRIGERPLEISSKSEEKLGIALSAFNLKGKTKKGVFTVETLFQSSKVFKEDEKSPYRDLRYKTSREAKKSPEIKENPHPLQHFQYLDGTIWDLEPKTAFYDWIYINTLSKFNHERADDLRNFDSFTDIEFNQKKA